MPILLSWGNALELTRDSAYTVSLGNQAKFIVPADLAQAELVIVIVRFLTAVLGLALWGLSAWFFLVSVGSLFKYIRPVHRAKMPFQMTWFSFVFPNTALVRISLPSHSTFLGFQIPLTGSLRLPPPRRSAGRTAAKGCKSWPAPSRPAWFSSG